ncbi:MAG: ESX secretion-associated protein EspG [Mycobacterium sp.]|nr:ESX secretion-associated protein EspG [Mycobacterium sp.]
MELVGYVQTWRFTPAQCHYLQTEHALTLPFPLVFPETGETVAEQATLVATAKRALESSGLLSRPGRLDADVEGALAILATPATLVDVFGYGETGAGDGSVRVFRAVAAISGTVGVVAEQTPDNRLLAVTVDRAEHTLHRLLRVLPNYPPGKIPAIDLPADDMRRPSHAPRRGTYTNYYSAVAGDKETRKHQAKRLLAGPHAGAGQIGTTNRNNDGRTARVLAGHWFSVPGDGRYLAWTDTAEMGHTWTRIRPATPNHLVSRIQHALSKATP